MIAGTAVIFCGAYLSEKGRGLAPARAAIHFLSMTPMAVPGLVLGLSYVFFFVSGTNPLHMIYGTMTILVVSTIIHYYPVSHLIAVTAGFVGTKLLLFGAIDDEGEVAVVVRGPEGPMVVRRKERVAGIWINRAQARFAPVPLFYWVATSRPFAEPIMVS